MTIIKRRRTNSFAIIPNAVADDQNLSFEALGMLTYLLAKPNDWSIKIDNLRNQGKIGRDKAYKLLNELKEAGYVSLIQHRDVDGRVVGNEYRVSDEPKLDHVPDPDIQEVESPHPDLPDTAEPDLDLPDPDLPDPVNQDVLIRTKNLQKHKDTKYKKGTKTHDRKAPTPTIDPSKPYEGSWKPRSNASSNSLSALLDEVSP